jgi:hypothetical protein
MSAMYCSRACQRIDWKKQHKQICKLLNVGHGDRQVRTDDHTSRSIGLKDDFEEEQQSLNEGMKRFFKLFTESTSGGSRAAARKMKKFAKRQSKGDQKNMLFQILDFLVRSSNLEMLSWRNSPLLVMLQIVDSNVLSGDEETSVTPLHVLAQLAAPSNYSTHVNQLILAKQLIEHGANVNAVTIPQGETPLHSACHSAVVTSLDFIELLLEEGADPNAQNHLGLTPLMCAIKFAPGAAKLLLKRPATDVNIISRSGESFLVKVRRTIKYFSDRIALLDNPEMVQHQLLLQQWRDIEEMLVERGAVDTGITYSD